MYSQFVVHGQKNIKSQRKVAGTSFRHWSCNWPFV